MSNNPFVAFIQWFFTKAPVRILRVGRNYLKWAWHFFSIGYFLPRLLAPWHRDITGYGRGFDFKRFLHVWGWNLISRVIGLVLRLVTMAIGFVVYVGIVILTGSAFVIWYALPVAIPVLVVVGFLTPLL